jgi:hypothetical protein
VVKKVKFVVTDVKEMVICYALVVKEVKRRNVINVMAQRNCAVPHVRVQESRNQGTEQTKLLIDVHIVTVEETINVQHVKVVMLRAQHVLEMVEFHVQLVINQAK